MRGNNASQKQRKVTTMAHMIEQYEDEQGRTASYCENTKQHIAWHGLGQKFDGLMTVAQAIEACRADYEVSTRETCNLTAEQVEAIMNGRELIIKPEQLIKDFKSVTRLDNDRTLGVVKNRYEVVNNSQAFDFVDLLTTGELGEKASIEAAGVLGYGERMFITAKFEEGIKIGNEDPIDLYFVFTNSFDGSSPVCGMVTPVRVVCNNTLNMAMYNNTGRINFRHTKQIKDKIAATEENMRNADACLGILRRYTSDLEKGIERLGNTILTEERIDQIIKEMLVPDNLKKALRDSNYNITDKKTFSTQFRNSVKTVRSNVYGGIGQAKLEEKNGLWLVNGITTAFQNGLKSKNDEMKFKNLMDGSLYKKLNNATNMILKVA